MPTRKSRSASNGPRVGIISIGEERSKGNQQTLEAAALLDDAPLHFIGHVEGKDIYEHHADVVVCDGFVGNVILKTSEGAGQFISTMLREMIDDAPPLGKLGALLLKPSFEKLRARLRYDTYGGAPLLGVRGCCIVTLRPLEPHRDPQRDSQRGDAGRAQS